jgi:hypothetical protein
VGALSSRRYFVCDFSFHFAAMKTLGILSFLLGLAIFVLPLLNVQFVVFYWLGNYRMLTAIILILVGIGIFLFSND